LAPLRQSASLTPVICDPKAISRLLEILLQKGGLTTRAAAQALGVSPQSLRKYLKGQRGKPSLYWFLNFCAACGAKLIVEFPAGDRRF
jgi:transcriptional regulator with XRE-family HTH domain